MYVLLKQYSVTYEWTCVLMSGEDYTLDMKVMFWLCVLWCHLCLRGCVYCSACMIVIRRWWRLPVGARHKWGVPSVVSGGGGPGEGADQQRDHTIQTSNLHSRKVLYIKHTHRQWGIHRLALVDIHTLSVSVSLFLKFCPGRRGVVWTEKGSEFLAWWHNSNTVSVPTRKRKKTNLSTDMYNIVWMYVLFILCG